MAKGDWKYKLATFMQGRYGLDELGQMVVLVAVLFYLIDIFARTGILSTLGTVLMIYEIYRMYSRNIEARRKELNWYGLHARKPKAWYRLTKKKWVNRKTTRYFKCAKCGQVLSVPKGVGKIRVTCPKCKDVTERKA